MHPEDTSEVQAFAPANPYTAADIASILQEHGWLGGTPSAEQLVWCERAAPLLGLHVAGRAALADLLGLVFHYDAKAILREVEAHAVLSRYAARDVLRELALQLLDGQPLDSDRFKVIITAMKESLNLRGRELFHPIRLALAGRAGEGQLDRVILLLEAAAPLHFAAPVKTARERILEFCAALD